MLDTLLLMKCQWLAKHFWPNRRLGQTFPHSADKVLGDCSCLLFKYFGQLPPVMDLPLYSSDVRSALSDLGRTAYQSFSKAVVLTQVMHQAGQDPEQVRFREIERCTSHN